jgi:methyl-accepting chemotaxis protein
MPLAIFSYLSIARKFLMLGCLAIVITIAGVWLTLKESYDFAFEQKRLEVRHLTESAAATFRFYAEKARRGELALAEAQRLALEAVGSARYEDGNYFFVYDFNGVSLATASKEQIGKNRLDAQDAKGTPLVRNHLAAAKAGGGFVNYYFPKAGTTEPLLKVSYIAPVTEWQWFVGTGLYVEDVDVAFRAATFRLAQILIPALAVFGILIFFMNRSVSGLLGALTASMKRLAKGDFNAEVVGEGRRDEIGLMAEAVATLKLAAIEKQRLESEAAAMRRRTDDERETLQATARAEGVQQSEAAVKALGDGLKKLSNGDLTLSLTEAFTKDYEPIRHDFNMAVEKLREVVEIIRSNGHAIRAGTEEISQAADDLSHRTEQQVASLEETVATLNQITATVRKTAEGASHARDVVSSAKTDAEQSGAIVREAIEAVGGIEKSSQQIGQIIGVIDEIAFQTNLLALNAGVEAARAGDAGRGFAVVASEVRALAQRSAEAAKEIKTLISASGQQVEQGVHLVGETGKALGRIVAQVAELNYVVTEIASSAQEQATGLHQVGTAMDQMDQMTQQNAAMVEETTAASHALVQETEELARLISRFETGRTANVAPLRRMKKPASAVTRPVQLSAGGSRVAAARKFEITHEKESWEEF